MQSLLRTAAQARAAASNVNALLEDPNAPPFCRVMTLGSPDVPFTVSSRMLVVDICVVEGDSSVVEVRVDDVVGKVVDIDVEEEVATGVVELVEAEEEDVVDVVVLVEVNVVDVTVLGVVSSSDVVALLDVVVMDVDSLVLAAAVLVLLTKLVVDSTG